MRLSIIACLLAGVLGLPLEQDEALAGNPVAAELDERDVTLHSTLEERASPPTNYKQIAVFAHNLHRKNHSAPDIEWSHDLRADAKIIAEKCVFAHDTSVGGGGYGQNIAAGVKETNISAIITNLWYNGEVGWFRGQYGKPQPNMTNFGHWGHFSQVVWAHSTQLGCYTADCSKTGLQGVGANVPPYFTVCNYHPPGNFANQYGANIGKPLGEPTASWNTGLGL